ncbi:MULTISPECIES: response regulator [Pseudomonas]|uniref:Response regulator n=1 Tax=Pseudomonas bubulae TaxID=2316085 RepID=A0ABZ2H513_9PSED|nr:MULTISPECIES: response regulator [Pseudomonas]MBP3861143.1 response regulator [Pseudomonas sp.]MQT82977.1 response regulator [Pseudomonas sp. FSL R10-2964]MQU51604.1 response regulator [Pseudomonas sp. FSL R10-1339]NMY56062.1 response regulator [Pseudomonas sp. WS 5051]OZY65614.1 DNA-binding response regulator [Pseudomonas fragi]
MPQMKVLLADDHPIVLMGVREIIERDPRFKVVGEAMSSSELIDKISLLKPDVIITDYNMPGDDQYGDGTRLVEYLRRHFPEPKVLILTVITNAQVLTWLYELGISGVISKSAGLEQILVALDAFYRQGHYQQDQPQGALSEDADDLSQRLSQLTVKEFEVLRLFSTGVSVSDVAHSLNRSIKTISTLKISAMRKLNVDNDQALLILCVKANLFA